MIEIVIMSDFPDILKRPVPSVESLMRITNVMFRMEIIQRLTEAIRNVVALTGSSKKDVEFVVIHPRNEDVLFVCEFNLELLLAFFPKLVLLYLHDKPIPEATSPNTRTSEQFDVFVPLPKWEVVKAKFDPDALIQEREKIRGMLNNPGFMNKAKADVITKFQQRMKEIETFLETSG